VYISDIPGFQVLKFSPDGTLDMNFGEKGEAIGQFKGQPIDMAIDAEGRLFVTETPEGGRVHVFAADGQPLAAWGAEGQFPLGIDLDENGNLYLTDYEANTLQKLRLLPLASPGAAATPLNEAAYLAIDPAGEASGTVYLHQAMMM
jgi:hypothetical protein